MDIGEEARLTMAIPISGNRNLGLYVGGTAPTFDVREDFINVYGETSATIAARGYDGTTDYGNETTSGAGADTLFIARTAENTFEVGFYTAGVRTVFESHTPATPNSADYVGIYADVRSTGIIGAIDSFQITSDPIEPEPVEPPVIVPPSNPTKWPCFPSRGW